MTQNETKTPNKVIVFFDGFCNLCNYSVDWLISRDKKRHLHFSSLQGETAKLYLSPEETQKLSSIVVITPRGEIFRESRAAFYLLRQVESGLKFLLIFSVLPTFITDIGYKIIAKNRIRLFGRRETCRLPTAEEKNYFLP